MKTFLEKLMSLGMTFEEAKDLIGEISIIACSKYMDGFEEEHFPDWLDCVINENL